MKILFFVLAFCIIGIIIPSAFAEEKVPGWIKNNAEWWVNEQIDDKTFVNGIQFLINEEIIKIDKQIVDKKSDIIPDWIRNTANWWITDQISETSFLNAIEFLVKAGIIIIEIDEDEKQIVEDPMRLLDDLSFLEQIIIPYKNSDDFINSHGFRGPEISKDKPENTLRIIIVGGSTTYGIGSDDTNTIPALLQKKLEKNNQTQLFEVINAGFSGAISPDEVKLIKEKLVDFSPDIVIVYDGFNDIKRYYGESINPEISQHSDKRLSPFEWKDRWIELCKFGTTNNFKTIVTLQPFLGTGEKLLTWHELAMLNGYSFSRTLDTGYDDYIIHLEEINTNCAASYDLSRAFDSQLGAIYWDYVHVGNQGNEVISQIFYEIVHDITKNETNDGKNIQKFSSSEYDIHSLLINKLSNEERILDGRDYSSQNLSGENFRANSISNTDFSNADLTNADFSFADIVNSNFNGADLTGANFAFTEIVGSDFSNAHMTDVNGSIMRIYNSLFHNTDMSDTSFEGSRIHCTLERCFDNTTLENTDLSRSYLSNLKFDTSKIHNSKFIMTTTLNVNFPEGISADFSGAKLPLTSFRGDLSNVEFGFFEFWSTNFAKYQVEGTQYTGTDLSYADLSKRDLSNQIFSHFSTESISILDFKSVLDIPVQVLTDNQGVKLRFTNLSESVFTGNNLTLADLTGANLSFSDLTNTSLAYTFLNGADLTGADLTGADLTGAELTGAELNGTILDCINHQICN